MADRSQRADAGSDVRARTLPGEVTPATSLGHRPPDRWAFDQEVTRVFEDMLRRSIPAYASMRSAVAAVARRYRQPKTDIVDLGASRGDAVAPLIYEYGAHNRFVLVEESEAMIAVLRQRFGLLEEAGVVDIRRHDLRSGMPPTRASVVLSVLTLQFTPLEHRAAIVERVFDDLLTGGAFVVVEKVLGSTRALDHMMTDVYYQLKRDNGYTDDEIETKRRSLEGVLVPLRAAWTEDLLRQAGFREVECFWRYINFAAWVAVK